jgi:hypothetical protein
MRQQLANKEKTDPMSMDNGGWVARMEKRQLQAEVVTALVKEALPDSEDQDVRSKAQAIGTCCSFGRLYYAGYVLKKNKQNRRVVSSQPFTTVFYHPPGTNDAEFLIR